MVQLLGGPPEKVIPEFASCADDAFDGDNNRGKKNAYGNFQDALIYQNCAWIEMCDLILIHG